MADPKSLAAEIEAVLNRHLVIVPGGDGPGEDWPIISGIPAAAAEIAALQSREGLIAFAREIIGYAFDGMDADGADIQALALTHGLLSKTTYDPKKHGPSMEADPGDDWYVLAGPLALAEQEKGDA